MATTIITKNSDVVGRVPLPADLEQGELAVNVTDKVLYTKNAAGEVVSIASGDSNVPLATTTTPGAVSVPPSGGLEVDVSGALGLNSELIAKLGFVPANTVYVDANGDPTIGSGGRDNPYSTVAQAVAEAPDNSLILVGPGSFAGDVATSGPRNLYVKGAASMLGQAETEIVGNVHRVSGPGRVFFEDLSVNYAGTEGAVRVSGSGGTVGFDGLRVSANSAQLAIYVDPTAVTANVNMDNVEVLSGKVEANSGNTTINFKDVDIASIVELKGGTLRVSGAKSIQRVLHTAGALHLNDIKSIGTSAGVSAIESSATGDNGGSLVIHNVSTWTPAGTQSFINKTGLAPYTVTGFTRNLASDVWNGTERAEKNVYDKDTVVSHVGTNYTGASGAKLDVHLTGIDTALGGKLGGVGSVGAGTSLVASGSAGTIKSMTGTNGITVTTTADVVNITTDAIRTLTDATNSTVDGVSLVGLGTGAIKKIKGGAGVTVSADAGDLVIDATAAAGVTSIEGLSGDVTISGGTGISVAATGNDVEFSNTGVLSIEPVAGGTSLVNAGSGQLKSLVPGDNVTITELDGLVTIASTGGGGTATLVENANTDPGTIGLVATNGSSGTATIKTLLAGDNVTLTEDAGVITVASTASASGSLTAVEDVPGAVGGQTLIVDSGELSGVAQLRRLAAGTDIALAVNGDGNLEISNTSTGGVDSVNGADGSVVLAGTPGNIDVTVDGQTITVEYVGPAVGSKVDSLNDLVGPVRLTSDGSVLINADPATGDIALGVTVAGIAQVTNTPSADAGRAALVYDDGQASGVAMIRNLLPGSNVTFDVSEEGVRISSPAGGGTVKSVNGIEPVETGDVVLDAASVGALSLAGGSMSGDIDMASNRITNLLMPETGSEPVTLDYLDSGEIVIDNGTF